MPVVELLRWVDGLDSARVDCEARVKRAYAIERKSSVLPLLFAAVFCTACGFLIGDWSADERFTEREASIIAHVNKTAERTERLRASIAESIKRGCYAYIDPTRPGSSKFVREM